MEPEKNDTELIRRLEKAKFINLDVTARDLVDATADVRMDEVDICPPLWIIRRPPPFGSEELLRTIKSLSETVNILTQKVEQMGKQ